MKNPRESLNKIQTKVRDLARGLKRPLLLCYYRWKYRNIDPDICCCGEMLSQARPYDSICAHGGCRSAKEYAITCALKRGT